MAVVVGAGFVIVSKPTVNILYLPGTNCQGETIRAFTAVGARARLVFAQDLLSGVDRIDTADVLCIPGGFSYGDHLGAGTIGALLLRTRLRAQLNACRERPILCICNGFQMAVRAGCFGGGIALTTNASGTFADVPGQRHVVDPTNPSPWLTGLGGLTLRFPCAHGEGRFVRRADCQKDDWRVALTYPDDENPDGSADGIAGITTRDGLMLGLMNHPERDHRSLGNLEIFANGVRFARV